MLRNFMTSMGLFSGSIDLIVDTDGEYWFLEVNQDGPWGWLNDIVDGEVAQLFASAFMAEINKRRGYDAHIKPKKLLAEVR